MRGEPVELIARHQTQGDQLPYQRLLHDAIHGDPSLFTRDDAVEAAWRVIDPVLGEAEPVDEYQPGTWGPAAAARVANGHGGWHDPKKEEAAPC